MKTPCWSCLLLGDQSTESFFFLTIGSSKSTTVQYSNTNIPLQMSGHFAEQWQHAWLGPKTNGQDVASFFPSLFSRSKVADKLQGWCVKTKLSPLVISTYETNARIVCSIAYSYNVVRVAYISLDRSILTHNISGRTTNKPVLQQLCTFSCSSIRYLQWLGIQ